MSNREQDALAETHLDDLGPAVDPLVGKTIGEKYRLLRRIGAGGMGMVYEAEHRVIGRRVAVKFLHAQLATDAEVVRRFLNEARAVSSIDHPGILAALDMGRSDDGTPFLVLELLRGVPLDRAVREGGPMPIGRAIRIALQCAQALDAAHAREIVHRDLKPENVFLLEGEPVDRVKVLDFGISKLGAKVQGGEGTRTGAMLGTPYYMAPEQMRDASRVDARADVWALGVMLWEMLAGRVPFTGGSLPDLMMKVCTETPPPLREQRPDVPDALMRAIDRALAKDPAERFASMREVAAALAPFSESDAPVRLSEPHVRPVPAQPTPMSAETVIPRETTPDARRGRGVALGLAAAAAVVLGVIAAVALGGGGAGEEAHVAGEGARGLAGSPLPSQLETPRPDQPPHAEPPPSDTAHALAAPVEQVEIVISSDARGAEASVRGAWRALPYRAAIDRSSESETIEVRAPGRASRRIAVVLDQDRTLSVDLARGPTRAGTESAATVATPATTEVATIPVPTEGAGADVAPRPRDGVYTGPTGDIPDSI